MLNVINIPSIELYVKKELLRTYLNNSVVSVLERTLPTEGPPLVGEVSANFYG
jgi:hypothetical protein